MRAPNKIKPAPICRLPNAVAIKKRKPGKKIIDPNADIIKSNPLEKEDALDTSKKTPLT
ncbi:hypothetical protein BN2364_2899 [Alloalcanivorax xenomutans]|nr:hypothetical protein BN2364_2899 [Alloalcanivorax xenomutans]